MKAIAPFSLALMLLTPTFGALAQDDVDHVKHHPASAQAQTPAPAKARPAKAAHADAAVASQKEADMQMKAMRNMHEKMLQAKTPEERKALAADHMAAMHEGMEMMKGMTRGAHSERQAPSMPMMQKQMEMMQMMMEMMMDRMPEAAPAH